MKIAPNLHFLPIDFTYLLICAVLVTSCIS